MRFVRSSRDGSTGFADPAVVELRQTHALARVYLSGFRRGGLSVAEPAGRVQSVGLHRFAIGGPRIPISVATGAPEIMLWQVYTRLF